MATKFLDWILGNVPAAINVAAIDVQKPSFRELTNASAIPPYQGQGKVTLTIYPMRIKVERQIVPDTTDMGLDRAFYTDRIHTATAIGAVVPPFRLQGPVPETDYSIDQVGASSAITLKDNDLTSKIATVALPNARGSK